MRNLFGNRYQGPCRCWAPPGVRPWVANQFVGGSTEAAAALGPHDGALVSLVLPAARTDAMMLFLADRSRRHPAAFSLLVVDGAGWHWGKAVVVPAAIRRITQPPHRPEVNPVEHRWDKLREQWLANAMFASLDAVEDQWPRRWRPWRATQTVLPASPASTGSRLSS